jgi:hypothetical protein
MAITINGSTGISGVPAGGYNLVDGDMPSGAVLQVVQETLTGNYSLSSAGSFTAISGQSATITPSSSSSKILILVNGKFYQDTNDTTAGISIFRNGSNLTAINYGFASCYGYFGTSPGNIDFTYPVNISYIDSPATTSAVTYALYYKSDQACQWNSAGRPQVGSIILMEIAA